MNKTEITNAFSQALEEQNFEQAGSYLAEDFVFTGPVPQPIGKQEFLAIQQAVQQAFPDWSFNHHDVQEMGEKVRGAVQITGTHTRDLALPMPGFPVIPATGKSISLPEEHLEFSFKGDKIASLTSDNTPGGGIGGVLAQIGVPMPQM
jgi:predicted ester cyclase